MTPKVPLNKEEIVSLQQSILEFSDLCAKYDSLGRVYAWIGLVKELEKVIIEEEIHNFEFPSSSNPGKLDIIKLLEES
jgi:hypothetical protein